MKTDALLPPDLIESFCRKWKIARLELFGSALRDDFRPDSDIDLLVTFAPETDWSLFDHLHMEEELRDAVGREIDLISRPAIEKSRNWIRKNEILETATVIYASR